MSQGFDLRVDIKDPSTGKVLVHQPYVMRCSASEGVLFERPPGSGYWYHANGLIAKEPEAKVEIKAVTKEQPKAVSKG